MAAVLVLRSHTVARSTYEHGEIAANLLAGRGFSITFLGATGPTSQQAPVYPFVVAAAYALGGVETPRALLILFAAQAVIGAVMALGVMRLARGFAPDRPGAAIAAGWVAALHPTLVYASTHVQVAGLAAALLVWCLVWAGRAGVSGRRRDAVVAGVLLGLLALTDPILALAFAGMAGMIAQGRGGWRAALRPMAVVAGVAALVLAPWTIRNAAVHGEFVLVKSTFGYAFWQGNCRQSAGTDKVERPSVGAVVEEVHRQGGGDLAAWNAALWAGRHEAGYLDDVVLTAADRAALGRLSEPERSRVLFRRAVAELRADPGRYPALCLKRLRMFVFFDETNPKTRDPLYRVSHLGLTLLAVLGWLRMGRASRWRSAPALLVVALVALFHALTITSARFHVPLEPILCAWAGLGLVGGGAAAARPDQPRPETVS